MNKDLLLAAGLLAVAAIGFSLFFNSMPILQVSYSTKQSVACASPDTHWEMRPASDPVCVEVAKGSADVEWVK